MRDMLEEQVSGIIRKTGMIHPGDSLLIGISGGQDSCALLACLCSMREQLGISLAAAHLNHGFRGAEADGDEMFVRDLCLQFGIDCIVRKENVPEVAKRMHISSQQAARRVRHQFLETAASQSGANKIALGHTIDDRTETTILHILRGTGTDGLQGLAPISGIRIRPLLGATRQDTLEYCHRLGIAYRTDSSNLHTHYARNRVRLELLPELASSYNPDIRGAMLRLGDIASAEADLLDQLAGEALKRMVKLKTATGITLDGMVLQELHPALQRRTLRQAIEEVRGDKEDVTFDAIERALQNIHTGNNPGFCETLPPGEVRVISCAGDLRIEMLPYPGEPLHVCREMNIPGETEIPEWKTCIHSRIYSYKAGELLLNSSITALLDADVITGKLSVRNRRPGDRLTPYGMSGSRKLQDIFTDLKIPRDKRDIIPIISDEKGILWILGVRGAAHCVPGPYTVRLLELKVMHMPDNSTE